MIEEAAVLNADQVGDLGREKMLVRARAVTPGGIASPASMNCSSEKFRMAAFGSSGSQGTSNWRAKIRSLADQFVGRDGGGLAQKACALAVTGIVRRGAGDNSTVGEYARVAGRAAHGAKFDRAFLADDPTGERDSAVGGDRHSGFSIECRVAQVGRTEEEGSNEVGALKTSSPAAIHWAGVW